MFMKANGYGASSKLTLEIDRIVAGVKETQEAFQKVTQDYVDEVDKSKSKTNELERFINKQEELNSILKQQNRDLQNKLNQLETQLKTSEPLQKELETSLAQAKADIGQMQRECSKVAQERDLSREQNRKLVELLQRMEKKLQDKTVESERLEEENIGL